PDAVIHAVIEIQQKIMRQKNSLRDALLSEEAVVKITQSETKEEKEKLLLKQ
ncbi:MAG: NADH-quinone oxidoreductase subunit B, partial [Chlorobiales bacterium]|nr:NADH-quinone oxidoreductase subunit B [Chlorobiales bacterium]